MNTRVAEWVRQDEDRQEKSGRTYSTLAVIGLGYVGLPLAIAAAEKGYDLIGFDIDRSRITQLRQKEASYLREDEQEALSSSEIIFSANPSVLREAEVLIICVPTPVLDDHTPDLRAVKGAAEVAGRSLSKGMLVIVESTVSPGICENHLLPILESTSGLRAEKDFYFAYCPERINPGDPQYTVKNIPRVLGASGPESYARAYEVYSSIIDAEIIEMATIKEAEAVKMVENAFRDINIAFVNELALAFKRSGIDILNVIRGAASKPFGFMPHFPGCGVGGHCIPVDPYYLIASGEENGFKHTFLRTARKINNSMPYYLVDLLEESRATAGLAEDEMRVALLGLAYKKGIGDTRESPALTIYEELKRKNIETVTYDPYVRQESTANSLSAALTFANAVIIATDHEAFTSIHPGELEAYGIRILLDGRNCLSKKEFTHSEIVYHGIGR